MKTSFHLATMCICTLLFCIFAAAHGDSHGVTSTLSHVTHHPFLPEGQLTSLPSTGMPQSRRLPVSILWKQLGDDLDGEHPERLEASLGHRRHASVRGTTRDWDVAAVGVERRDEAFIVRLRDPCDVRGTCRSAEVQCPCPE